MHLGRICTHNLKNECDEYFTNTHRNNEMRGVGGVFYDYLKPLDEADAERLLLFQQSVSNHIFKCIPAYR